MTIKLRPGMSAQGPSAEDERLIGLHFEYVKRLTADSVALQVGRTPPVDDETLGVLVFRAEDEGAARALCANDPAVQGGVFVLWERSFQVFLLCDSAQLEGHRAVIGA